MQQRDVVVIGGGPAGYVAAVRASQLGAKVSLIEKAKLGGACLHRACVPTKFLLHALETHRAIANAGRYGVSVAGADIALSRVQPAKNSLINRLLDSLTGLMEENGVEVITGTARLTPSGPVALDDQEAFQADKIIIASGSTSICPPIPGADAADILWAEDILSLESVPESLALIGGGVVGVEMAAILAGLGCRVTLVEIMPHILPQEDAEIAAVLERALRREGVQTLTGARVSRIETADSGKKVVVTTAQGERAIEAGLVAIAVGQQPCTEGLDLAARGVVMAGDCIQTSERLETSVPGIYAAGDVTGHAMLAYVAMAEGKAAAENALGGSSRVDYDVIPRCIFSLPEIGAVGLTEDEAVKQGFRVQCGRFPFSANSMANILAERRGLVKMVTEAASGRILGVHIAGPGAVDLIAEATLAMKMGATAADIGQTLHAHPTLSEALWQAALDVSGQAIDFKPLTP